MPVPPQYTDLGKSAKDLFEKGFGYGFAKVDLKTKTSTGVEFTTKGASCNESGNINGSLETKYKQPKHGLTFTEKWTTDNNLSTEVAIEDQIATGMKLTLCTSFAPNTGKKSGALKTAYKRDYINCNLDTDFNFAGPTLQGACVFGYEGWLAGYQFAFDTNKSALTKNNVAVGYNGADFQLLTTMNDASEFGGSIYQSVNKNLATGIQLSWSAGQNNTKFGVATKYNIDADASLNAKVNNVGQVGFGYSHQLRTGVKLTLSSLVDAKNLNGGGHKLGLGVEFEV
ncbi:non-selective voltage-gated ion channel VDAC2 [Ciona intestinalis]